MLISALCLIHYKLVLITDEEYFRFLSKLRQRGGVQVVLRDREGFQRYLEGVDHEAVDDNGCCINGPIPSEFIETVVPLGEYEKRSLTITMLSPI